MSATRPSAQPLTNRRVHASLPWSDPASAAQYLDGLAGYETTGVLDEKGTSRIGMITAGLGSPNRRFPSIHVTGTNGKGSTSAMISALLRGRGLRVGTYTSPHLSEVRERVVVDESQVSAERFAEALGAVAWMSRRIGVRPSWFEAITASAFLVFAEDGVDAAVVEVGMLGRWDATNIIDSSVAVITNVELDHTEYAGPDRVHIAEEKAGIIRPETALVLGEQDPALLPIFRARRPSRLLQLGVDLAATDPLPTPSGSSVDLSTPWGLHRAVPVNLLGRHQCDNAALSLAAAQAFLNAPLSDTVIRDALGSIRLPGRAEVLRGARPVVVVDGAHNRAAARALRDTVEEHFPTTHPRVLVCATSGTRDPAEFLEGVGARDFDLVVATEVPATISAESVASAARQTGATAIVRPDVGEALRAAVTAAGVGGMVVVGGSLYLVGPISRAMSTLAIDENDCESG